MSYVIGLTNVSGLLSSTSIQPHPINILETKKVRRRGGAASCHYSQRQFFITRAGSRNSATNIPLVYHANNSEVNDMHAIDIQFSSWYVYENARGNDNNDNDSSDSTEDSDNDLPENNDFDLFLWDEKTRTSREYEFIITSCKTTA